MSMSMWAWGDGNCVQCLCYTVYGPLTVTDLSVCILTIHTYMYIRIVCTCTCMYVCTCTYHVLQSESYVHVVYTCSEIFILDSTSVTAKSLTLSMKLTHLTVSHILMVFHTNLLNL